LRTWSTTTAAGWVDFIGDNFLAEFPTATDAVEIQRVMRARIAALPEGRKIEFRIGVHLGEVRSTGEGFDGGRTA
jgi:class 3 adenylate cyclase